MVIYLYWRSTVVWWSTKWNRGLQPLLCRFGNKWALCLTKFVMTVNVRGAVEPTDWRTVLITAWQTTVSWGSSSACADTKLTLPLSIHHIISIQPEGRLWQEPEPSQATACLHVPRKSATWETALLPPQGRHAVDFFARKIRRLRPGSNPRSWVPEASMLTTRPPKPLCLYIRQKFFSSAFILVQLLFKCFSGGNVCRPCV